MLSICNFSGSDSDDSFNRRKINLTGLQHGGGTRQEQYSEKATESHPSSFKSYASGSSSTPLNANVAESDSRLISAAVSPDEIYNFVFASVEEEMTGDPSYLVAIIIEFLRR